MSDDHPHFDPSPPLPPELEGLHRRLSEAGEAWRSGLPSAEPLERYFQALSSQEPIVLHDAERTGSGRSSSRVRPGISTKGDSPMSHGRMRTVTAAVALAAVVMLFAVLFYSFAGRGAQSAAGPSGAQQKYSQYVPMVAPSDPHVIYKLVPAGGSSAHLLLARSTDSGTTWQTFALPAGTSTDPIPPGAFVSPLNPQFVFLTVTTNPPSSASGYQSCPQPHAPGSTLNSDAVFSGGHPLCTVEYLTPDGGAHWGLVHLPASAMPAALGDTSGYVAHGIALWSTGSTVFHAQGNRLYSTTNVSPGVPPEYPEGQSTLTIRIVVSTDGGLTWTSVDEGLLAASGQRICDYTASPSGSTLFAVTSTGCDNEGAPPLFLWRSDDAGGHWVKVEELAGLAERGMLAVSRGDGQVPLLYLNVGQAPNEVGPQHTNASPPPTPVGTPGPSGTPGSKPTSSGGCAGVASIPTDVQVSADGGKTWKAAPAQGFPAAGAGPTAPLGVLSDGSVLFARCPTQGTATTFYAWKLGDASWQQVGASFDEVETAFVVSGAANTVCVVTGVKSGYEVHTFHT